MNRQNLEAAAGEDRTLTLRARTAANVAMDLTGYTLSWRVGRAPSNPKGRVPLFTKTGTITGASTGTFTVPLAGTDTSGMDGDYLHEAWATLGGSSVQVVAGRLRITSTMEAG